MRRLYTMTQFSKIDPLPVLCPGQWWPAVGAEVTEHILQTTFFHRSTFKLESREDKKDTSSMVIAPYCSDGFNDDKILQLLQTPEAEVQR